MTDLKKLLSVIEGKVKYEKVDNYKWIKEQHFEAEICISLENSYDPEGNELGYFGFGSNWFFGEDGNFLGVGHFE